MRDLTGRVAALRDAFSASQQARAKSRHDLATALHERLAGYRQDRHGADAAWRGTAARQRPAPRSTAGPHRTDGAASNPPEHGSRTQPEPSGSP